MRVSRFHVPQELAVGLEVALTEKTSHYVARVLKLRPDDPLVLFNGDGADYAAQLVSVVRQQVTARIHSRLPAVAESPLSVTLVQGISRGERMDLSLQKATELGAAAVQPVFTERVQVRLSGQRLDHRMQHWRSVLCSSCEQCGRARIPDLHPPLDLSAWLGQDSGSLRLVLDPEADRALSGLTLAPGPLDLLVGPEGGLSPTELALVIASGVVPVRLGPRILRTETAGPAALAVLQALAGDF
jgi:16S rRNA (uracil1498-N3)-methyltransferase